MKKKKKTYRSELKERLHNKQNMFKQQRTNHNLLKKSMDAKIKKTTDDVKNTTENDGQEEQIPKLEEVGEIQETETYVRKIGENVVDSYWYGDKVITVSDLQETEKQEKQEIQGETQTETLEDFVN